MVRDEKQRATILGVVAASFLTGIKLLAGILSNSLAVLAEAAHSGLDLASAFIGLFAVRVSERRPDKEHMYGHGKADSVGGFFAALLLLLTCAWVLYEGVNRLFFRHVYLDVGLLAFGAIAISIFVDVERTLVFRRVAKKTGSPTMSANALHFASDIASSVMVFIGLVLVTMGYLSIDTLLAMGIAIYFGFMSVRLSKDTISDLLDRAPAGLTDAVEEIVSGIKGVESFDHVRVRKSGSRLFVDMVVNIDHRTPFLASHTIASKVEKAVGARFEGADVVVHVNPTSHSGEIVDKIREIALSEGASGVHGVDIESYGREMRLNIHLEFSPSTRIRKAHQIASKIEAEVHKSYPRVTEVITHLEPETQKQGALKTESRGLTETIRRIATSQRGLESCHEIFVAKVGEGLHVSMHCAFDENLTVNRVHEISTTLEEEIKREVEEVADVTIHSEPGPKSHRTH